jgi:hypothetical protein
MSVSYDSTRFVDLNQLLVSIGVCPQRSAQMADSPMTQVRTSGCSFWRLKNDRWKPALLLRILMADSQLFAASDPASVTLRPSFKGRLAISVVTMASIYRCSAIKESI